MNAKVDKSWYTLLWCNLMEETWYFSHCTWLQAMVTCSVCHISQRRTWSSGTGVGIVIYIHWVFNKLSLRDNLCGLSKKRSLRWEMFLVLGHSSSALCVVVSDGILTILPKIDCVDQQETMSYKRASSTFMFTRRGLYKNIRISHGITLSIIVWVVLVTRAAGSKGKIRLSWSENISNLDRMTRWEWKLSVLAITNYCLFLQYSLYFLCLIGHTIYNFNCFWHWGNWRFCIFSSGIWARIARHNISEASVNKQIHSGSSLWSKNIWFRPARHFQNYLPGFYPN